MSEKQLPSHNLQSSSQNTKRKLISDLKSLKERLAYYTQNGGLKEIPPFYEDQFGDWQTINSTNPFEVLYLYYREIEILRSNPQIIDLNYSTLKSFWEMKYEEFKTGANRILLEKKYGAGTIESALIKLDKAYKLLKTELENCYILAKSDDYNKAREIIEVLLKLAIKQDILPTDKESEVIEIAKSKTDLNEDEIIAIINSCLVKLGAKRETNIPKEIVKVVPAQVIIQNREENEVKNLTNLAFENRLSNLSKYYQDEFRKIYFSGETYKGKWNWSAFFFGGIWALSKGLWLSFLVSIGVIMFTWGLALFVYPFIYGIRGNWIYYNAYVKNKQLAI